MAYCTSAEVEADFKDLPFSTTTNVKTADVEQFITEADALIDSYVGMKYVVPVTASASALALLKLYSRSLVADRIKNILEVKQATNKDANQNVRSGLSTSDVLKLLKAIGAGEVTLAGATELASSGGFFSNNYADSVAPVMEKDTKQW